MENESSESFKGELYKWFKRGLDRIKENKQPWIRGMYMLAFLFLYYLAEMVLLTVAVLQFLNVLIVGRPNAPLRAFGRGLCRYAYDVLLFISYGSEKRPFPFTETPEEEQRHLRSVKAKKR